METEMSQSLIDCKIAVYLVVHLQRTSLNTH